MKEASNKNGLDMNAIDQIIGSKLSNQDLKNLPRITIAELAQHCTEESSWIAVRDIVGMHFSRILKQVYFLFLIF